MNKERPLTPLQKRFVEEYLVDLNATRAAIRAGYSRKSAYVIGPRNLRSAAVAAAIDRAIAVNAGTSRSRLVEELAAVAFADAGDFFAWGPDGVALKDSTTLSDAQRRAVTEISESRTASGGTVKVKLGDKLAALEKLGRALGLFRERAAADDASDIEAETDPRELAKAVMAALAAAETSGATPDDTEDKETNDDGRNDDPDDL